MNRFFSVMGLLIKLRSDEHGVSIGTTTAAFVLKKVGCIILGADKEKGNISGSTKLKTDKVFQLGENLEDVELPQGYTRAGYEKDVDFMRAQLDTYVKENRNSSDITKMPEHVLRSVFDSNDQISAKHKGHLLLGGYNKGLVVPEPHLYYISSSGVLDLTNVRDIVELQNRFQTGSGAGAAFYVLNEKYDPTMEEEDGIFLILETIYNGIKNDKYTGEAIEYMVIRSNGSVEKREVSIRQFEEMRRQRMQQRV
ncbi:hypothetical protein MKW94_028827 [Papaver nudicaule]|uniref:Uncharacterized protein n=1 Tax=Papaver nudicaule TaxID=74823 RepID=A0AA41VPK1_PAPNU|nr:hypothetical protein [Papaver nudicaule]